jgi:hypothetical protein
MRGSLVLGVGVVLLATACGGPDAAPPANPPDTPSITTLPAPDADTGDLPTARNGTDYAACGASACEVQVVDGTRLTAMGIRLRLRVDSRRVRFTTDGYSSSVQVSGSPGGRNTIGLSGRQVTARVVAVQGDRAVVSFS